MMRLVLVSLVVLRKAESEQLPWPFRWIHPPKDGSFFAVAISELLCNFGVNQVDNYEFQQFKGSQMPCKIVRLGNQTMCNRISSCAVDQYYSLIGQKISLSPHDPKSFADGHFPVPPPMLGSGSSRKNMADDLVMLTRDPANRLQSQWNQGLQTMCETHIKNAPCLKRKEVQAKIKNNKGQRRNNCASFAAWTRIYGVKSCQTKMLLGRPCSSTVLPTPIEMDSALQLITNGNSSLPIAGRDGLRMPFVGDTDRWNLSVCLFFAKFGDQKEGLHRCPPTKALSLRDTQASPSSSRRSFSRRFPSGCPQNDVKPDFTDEPDAQLHAAAKRRVDAEWLIYRHRVSHCSSCQI